MMEESHDLSEQSFDQLFNVIRENLLQKIHQEGKDVFIHRILNQMEEQEQESTSEFEEAERAYTTSTGETQVLPANATDPSVSSITTSNARSIIVETPELESPIIMGPPQAESDTVPFYGYNTPAAWGEGSYFPVYMLKDAYEANDIQVMKSMVLLNQFIAMRNIEDWKWLMENRVSIYQKLLPEFDVETGEKIKGLLGIG